MNGDLIGGNLLILKVIDKTMFLFLGNIMKKACERNKILTVTGILAIHCRADLDFALTAQQTPAQKNTVVYRCWRCIFYQQ